ncbi:MAG: isoaspartyl peptidase/L-asparaginase [Sphingobacterium sp.]|jgi:beta-aspartyl-peptidase (threonine type)|nr:isoaspartyl peptidase/L-asparaginase [Sphingobacterium sp.]
MKIHAMIAMIIGGAAVAASCNQQEPKEKQQMANEKFVLAIHGGAGTILKKNMTDSMEQAYKIVLEQALQAGYNQLKEGKSSLDAVEQAIHVMEDSPLFNAGKGAVFTNAGKNELDASIMDGKTLAAGAVAGVTTIRNPISAARAVMEKSEHVMMVGKGAEEFAKEVGLQLVDPSYFWTKMRWDALQKIKQEDSSKTQLDHDQKHSLRLGTLNKDYKFGTVGCVALDNQGNLAAGTSTGGMTNKKFGRVGDSPIIGAGTYANNTTCAVSCTGWGEFYIRNVAAYAVSALMEYKGDNVSQAGQAVIDRIGKMGGDGGMIVMDKEGHVAMPFNTEGMYRGTVNKDGKIKIEIYK